MLEIGPQLEYADYLHAQKYRGAGESFREAMNRIAGGLRDDNTHFGALRDILLDMRFLPGGRVQAAVGSSKSVTAFNCFVSGAIEDSFVDGSGSIMGRAREAAATMRMGGGIGYDFSSLRPRGAVVRKLSSQSCGPLGFMEIYDAVGRATASAGHRRGAQMGVMRIDHPDIEDFIHIKQNKDKLTSFNISVAVTDEFMGCLSTGRPFSLRFGGEVYRQIDPEPLWEMLMRSTWDWAEPGVLFIDTINRMNNLSYCETIWCTNPCGEQPLPPHGACLLGSFNLVRYVNGTSFEWDQFTQDIEPVVRAMDNVIDRTHYPLYEQEKEAKLKRRMGMGITGLANAGEALGFPYGTREFLEFEDRVLSVLRDETYIASSRLAQEKGSFPAFIKEKYLQGMFIGTLDGAVTASIAKHGIRNSHLTSIAPCGTISLCADNISSGIEPVFAHSIDRTIMEFEGPRTVTFPDYGAERLSIWGRKASEISVDEHLAVMEVAARLVDSSVSKTCNVPAGTPWEDFKHIYVRAWEAGCKGCTTYQVAGKRQGVITETAEEGKCYIDSTTGRRECE